MCNVDQPSPQRLVLLHNVSNGRRQSESGTLSTSKVFRLFANRNSVYVVRDEVQERRKRISGCEPAASGIRQGENVPGMAAAGGRRQFRLSDEACSRIAIRWPKSQEEEWAGARHG